MFCATSGNTGVLTPGGLHECIESSGKIKKPNATGCIENFGSDRFRKRANMKI
jgi:hypothetical protein